MTALCVTNCFHVKTGKCRTTLDPRSTEGHETGMNTPQTAKTVRPTFLKRSQKKQARNVKVKLKTLCQHKGPLLILHPTTSMV